MWMRCFLVFCLIQGCTLTIPARDLSKIRPGKSYNRLGEYILGPGDSVSVVVLGEDTVTGAYTVSPKGTISMPLVGEFKVLGQSTVEVTKNLTALLKKYLRNPAVTVQIASIQNLQVYFAGEIRTVGRVPLGPNTNLLQGLIIAGGLSEFASGRIVIIRDTGNNTKERYYAFYNDLLLGRKSLDGFYLEGGDIIHAE